MIAEGVGINLSQPAVDLFGEAEARVLHRLAVLSDGASGRRIHGLSGVVSLRTTQGILDRLVHAGLVDVRRVGSANDYKLNRNHILWDPIQSVLDAPARLESAISKEIQRALGDEIEVAAVYGSFARGTAHANSDIDILIVWRTDVNADRREEVLFQVSEQIGRMTGNTVQILTLTRPELASLVREDDPLIDSLRADGRDLIATGVELKQLITKERL